MRGTCCGVMAGVLVLMGVPAAQGQTLEERVRVLEERNQELYHTLAQKKAGGLGTALSERLSLSGLVEVEGYYEQVRMRGDEPDESASDFVLATAQLGVTGRVTEQVSATVLLLYEDGDGGVQVDEGTIDYERGRWGARAGLQYLPFGVYYSHFVSGPVLQDLGELQDVGVTVGYELVDGVRVQGFVYNGDAEQVNGSGEAYDDQINGWGLSVGGLVGERLGFAVGYLSNLADTGSELVDTYRERVGGWSAGLLVTGEGWEATAEALGAVKGYDAEDLDGDGDGDGDRPMGWNVEAAWQGLESVEVAVRVEGTREYVGQPRVQYGAVVSWAPWEGVNLSAELLRGEYDEEWGEGVDSRTVVTTQLAAEF